MEIVTTITLILLTCAAIATIAYWRNTPTTPPGDIYSRTVAALGDPYQIDTATPEFAWPTDSPAVRRHRQTILDRITNEH